MILYQQSHMILLGGGGGGEREREREREREPVWDGYPHLEDFLELFLELGDLVEPLLLDPTGLAPPVGGASSLRLDLEGMRGQEWG